MRTTLTIDDDVLAAARCMAETQGISLGAAMTALARRRMTPIGLRMSQSGVLVFDVPSDLPVVTDEMVAEMMADSA